MQKRAHGDLLSILTQHVESVDLDSSLTFNKYFFEQTYIKIRNLIQAANHWHFKSNRSVRISENVHCLWIDRFFILASC